MSSDLSIDAPTPAVPRDRWGRPLVAPPDGGKPVGYTRCTTFVDALDDKYNLGRWQQRMVAIGLADRPDLLLSVAAHRDDKKELDRITEQALDAAKAGAAATTGTALHALTERIDRRQPIGAVPSAYQADLDAYRRATVELEPVAIEEFTVLDEFRVGGTPDRVVEYRGQYYIADVKTGSIDYSALKIGMQLAVYSRSTPYDHATKKRTPRPYAISTDRAIVIHLPAGEGRCELRWIDIAAGWAAVQVAADVRNWRAHKDWYTPFDTTTTAAPTNSFLVDITNANTVDDLRKIYYRAAAAGAYDDTLAAACLARKAEIEAAA